MFLPEMDEEKEYQKGTKKKIKRNHLSSYNYWSYKPIWIVQPGDLGQYSTFGVRSRGVPWSKADTQRL